eukprot:8062670-Pyramimonas_sp.AAC.1
MIGNRGYAHGRPAAPVDPLPSDVDSTDIVNHFYDSPREAHECVRHPRPLAIWSLVVRHRAAA